MMPVQTTLAALAARAGGGHSFSGGGGSSRSSGGGGGGFFFFGGGGGGGGGGILGFVILVVIVLVIVGVFFALRRSGRTFGGAIGAATGGLGGGGLGGGGSGSGGSGGGGSGGGGLGGGEAPAAWSGSQAPAIDSIRGDVFPGTDAVAHSASPVAEGLGQIEAHDPAFNEEGFLESVQKAFFVVQEAWTDRKPDMSRQVMADGLWQQHRTQIEKYVEEHKRNVLEDLAVGGLSVVSAHSDQTFDTITVRVLAACSDYDVDDESGKKVRGNRSVEQWQEDWTFQRSSQATTKPAGGTLSSKCPNCGAPLDLDLQGVCKFCHAPVMSGKYDWVLARIAQVM